MLNLDGEISLPNLVVIGERRSGSTWLSKQLGQHPAVFVHPKRDRGYFLDDDARHRVPASTWEESHNKDDYRAWFGGGDHNDQTIACEKSADYLFWRPAHERLARFLPGAKYIAVLRHPVRRAWSHYWIEVGKGREHEDFGTALALESARAAQPFTRNHLSYRTRGYYDDSIEHFCSVIPRRSLHVLTLEELVRDRTGTMNAVFDFLGIEQVALPEMGVESQNRNWVMTPKTGVRAAGFGALANTYGAAVDSALKLAIPDRDRRRRVGLALKSPLFDPASAFTMDGEIARDLADGFAPHVRRLEKILGRSFVHWEL